MALFKISKGQAANLPTKYNEGWCYFTTDDGKFYIDTSGTGGTTGTRIAINANNADHVAWSGITNIPTLVYSVATGSSNGTISVNQGGTTSDVAVKGLAAAAYKGVTDNSSAAAVSTSDTNLITGRTLANAGYVKTSGVTSITLKAGAGISLDTDNTAITSTGTRTITNSGVREVKTGSTNGTISVNTDGTSADVAVKGLGSAAYTASTDYATSGHKHTTSIATSDGTSSLTLAFGSKYSLTAGGNSYIFTMPSNPNTNTTYAFTTGDNNGEIKVTPSSGTAYPVAVKGLGSAAYTASTDYATSGHTHTTTIADGASGDTNQKTLAFGTKYKLTAGGTNYIFTMPSNPNTNALYSIGSSLSSHKITTSLTASGSGGTSTSTDFTLVAGDNITLTDDTTNRKITIASTNPEASLTWGGKDFSASYGPIDAAMIDLLGANRFAFLKAAGITVEYSTNGGSSYSDYGATDAQKVGLFSSGQGFYLGKHTTNGSCTTNDRLRVTIDTGAASIYTVLNKIAIYMSTSGATVEVLIEKALQSTPTAYTTHKDWTGISGWSGWNILNISELTTYGNTAASQYGRIRFTFRQTAVNTNYTSASISKIQGYGGMGWTVPSNMAANGHLYSYDSSQNATFPAKVTATSFVGTASGNLTNVAWDSTNSRFTRTKNGTTEEIITIATLKTALGLGSAAYTASTDYATSGHTHTTTIADGTSGDTNQKTLAFGTKYKLTAGGTSYIFTMPSNPNTNTTYTIAPGDSNGYIKVTPSAGTAYGVLVTGGPFLPLAGGTVTGETTFNDAVLINDELSADSAFIGNLLVTGAANFTNGITGNLTGSVTGTASGNLTNVSYSSNKIQKTINGTTSTVATWSAGTLPSLTVSSVACDDITAWSAGTAASASYSAGVLTFTNGTAPSLSYTARSVGSASGWGAGTLPSLT